MNSQPIVYTQVVAILCLQTIVNNYDQNKDGRLDYDEFLGYIMDRERKWIINFHALDKNKCGECQHLPPLPLREM